MLTLYIDNSQKLCYSKYVLTTIPDAINELRRVVLLEKVWVLGNRTPACAGKVRLAIFRGRKRIPLKQEALNDLESGSHLSQNARFTLA
jgi:hypothetical protein